MVYINMGKYQIAGLAMSSHILLPVINGYGWMDGLIEGLINGRMDGWIQNPSGVYT